MIPKNITFDPLQDFFRSTSNDSQRPETPNFMHQQTPYLEMIPWRFTWWAFLLEKNGYQFWDHWFFLMFFLVTNVENHFLYPSYWTSPWNILALLLEFNASQGSHSSTVHRSNIIARDTITTPFDSSQFGHLSNAFKTVKIPLKFRLASSTFI